MDIYSCEGCGDHGSLEPSDCVNTTLVLLASADDETMWCLPCWCKRKSICLNCCTEAHLVCDTSCNAKPMLCEDCLGLPYRIHMFSCYIDGCMTPGELAAEECRIMGYEAQEKALEEGEEWKNGYYP